MDIMAVTRGMRITLIRTFLMMMMMSRRRMRMMTRMMRITFIRTFLDLKSLWAIAGFKPWPLLAPSSPGK